MTARLLMLLRAFPGGEPTRKKFVTQMIAWSCIYGEYPNGDPELHHAAGSVLVEGMKRAAWGINFLIALINEQPYWFYPHCRSRALRGRASSCFWNQGFSRAAGERRVRMVRTGRLSHRRSLRSSSSLSILAIGQPALRKQGPPRLYQPPRQLQIVSQCARS